MRKFRCDYHYVDDLIRRYEEAGGQVICLNDGCLASGEWLLVDDMNKMKCFYTYELALTEWSSCQVVHVYSCWDKLPKKVQENGRELRRLRLTREIRQRSLNFSMSERQSLVTRFIERRAVRRYSW